MVFTAGSTIGNGIGRSIIWVAEITTQPCHLDTKFSSVFIKRIKDVAISGASSQIDFYPAILSQLKSISCNLTDAALNCLLWSDAPAIAVTRKFVILKDWIGVRLYGTPSFDINKSRGRVAAVQPIRSYSPSRGPCVGNNGSKGKTCEVDKRTICGPRCLVGFFQRLVL